MRRETISWMLGDAQIYASLDSASNSGHTSSAILIVSGGNEIRSGSHGSQAQLSEHLCNAGYNVLRYDRRGIGDSEGENKGFAESGDDMRYAVDFLRQKFGEDVKIIAIGNCDAACALLTEHRHLHLGQLILTNPWTIDDAPDEPCEAAATPNAAAIRARYWARIKNPRSIIDLLSGKIDLKKLIGGLSKARQKPQLSKLSTAMAQTLSVIEVPTHILLAKRDTTCLLYTSPSPRDRG